MSRSPITCHVLDAAQGKPAANVKVALELLASSENLSQRDAKILATGVTNSDGRCSDLLPSNQTLLPGMYKMTFHSGDYFKKTQTETFYPFVEITFLYNGPSQHYHIPLLLSPFSYTTYRGS
ncbi:hydroxyisourate hydrolase [Cryptococcus depauperatus]